MIGSTGVPLVSVAVPVRNGADTLAPVVESVLAQSHSRLELVICDNASTDTTEEVAREFAASDARVVYHRHSDNIGLLNNFRFAASLATGQYVRWLGDSDWIHPDYVARALEAFADDPRRVVVTTQMTYVDRRGETTLDRTYRPTPLASGDPLERLGEMLRLLNSGFALLDPLYSLIRRDVATMPRRNILREDEVFAARLALAGPWGHVPMPLARRARSELDILPTARLLGVPLWQALSPDLLQCRELLRWVDDSLGPDATARARTDVVRFYGRRKLNTLHRGAAKLARISREVSLPRVGVSR